MAFVANLVLFSGGAVVLCYLGYFVYRVVKDHMDAKRMSRELVPQKQACNDESYVGARIQNDPRLQMCKKAARNNLLLDLKAVLTYWKMEELHRKIRRNQ